MKKTGKELQPGDKVYVGIDMHKLKWHVTARTADFELFSGSIPGKWEALQRILGRYQGLSNGTSGSSIGWVLTEKSPNSAVVQSALSIVSTAVFRSTAIAVCLFRSIRRSRTLSF